MFETTMEQLSQMDRPAAYYRALMQCLRMMDPIQFRRVSAREIAEASGMSMISAQRAFAMMQSDRVLFTKGRGAAMAYRLNNNLLSTTSSEKWNCQDRDPEVIDSRGRS